jgi:hypothetical protein
MVAPQPCVDDAGLGAAAFLILSGEGIHQSFTKEAP